MLCYDVALLYYKNKTLNYSCVHGKDYSELQEYIDQGSDTVLKALNCEISFQDLEKVLNLAKMHIQY